jgi:hypothetical protein
MRFSRVALQSLLRVPFSGNRVVAKKSQSKAAVLWLRAVALSRPHNFHAEFIGPVLGSQGTVRALRGFP